MMENESIITELGEPLEDTVAEELAENIDVPCEDGSEESLNTDGEALTEQSEGENDGDELFDTEAELDAIKAEFPELSSADVEELCDTKRFAELIALGLTAREAYLATAKVRRAVSDNRAHLSSAVPRGAKSPIGKMSASELRAARELFAGASDKEIMRLYKRVTN